MNKSPHFVYLILLFASIICILFTTSCRQNKKTANETTVGVILPLSGDLESYGKDCMKGIVFANSRDSLNIRYIFEDSRGEASIAVNAYNKLINFDKVDYVLGDMLSQTTESMAPLALQNQKLLVSPTASSKAISKDNIYALSVFPCETYESKIVAGFAKDRYEKVGVLYEKVAAAQAMRDAFAEVFNENELVLDEAFESSITSFRDIIFKVRKSGCKAVYLITYSNNAIKLISQLKALHISVDLIGQSALYDPALLSHLSDYGAGFYLTGPLFNMVNEDTMSKDFIKSYMEVIGEEPNQMSTQGYVAAVVAHNLYQFIKQGNYSKETILSYKRNIFGSVFQFDDELTSTSGLRMYQYDANSFNPLDE